LYLPYRTVSPFFTERVERSPLSLSLPGPTAMTSPLSGFSLADSGRKMPEAVFVSAAAGLTRTRSSRGRTVVVLLFFFGAVAVAIVSIAPFLYACRDCEFRNSNFEMILLYIPM